MDTLRIHVEGRAGRIADTLLMYVTEEKIH